MAPPVLTLQTMHLTFGGTPLLTGADLMVGRAERACLVGRNGSGKSTLLKIAAGLVEADGGERFVHPGASLAYLPQEVDFKGFATTRAYVEAGLAPAGDLYRAAYLLEALGLSGDEDPERLSGGEARRAALAAVLAPQPDIVLLDEPTNHLDLPAILWLEEELKSMSSALVLISHDRRFLETLAKTTIWLDRGATRRLDRGFAHFESWRDELLEREELDRHKLDRKIAAEEDWMRYGVTARRKRNMRRVAQLAELRKDRREAWLPTGNVKMAAAEAEISGKLVIEAKGLAKSYGVRPIVADFSTRIGRASRIGIVGPNGAGKTTLLGLLTGALAPDAGSIRLGANIEMATLDQKRDELVPTATVKEALTGGRGDNVVVGGVTRHVVSYMKDFLFSPEQARTPLGRLSGGERGRLMLARVLARPSNLLVLDEPTNDLDLETLDLLQEMLAAYQGTVLLVSHDRDFLDRVVTSVIAFEGDGRWVEYAGGYSDMAAQRRGAGETPRHAAKTRAKPAGGATGSAGAKASRRPPREPQKRKLSFKDKHALKTLPEKMESLQRDIALLQSKLAEPDLYGRDRAAFEAAAAKLKTAEAALARAEEDWLRLELLREELEGG